jgi:hypothetical protein
MAAAQGSMVAPIFPLPNVVFFPHTLLPLHIFEPRYRHMIHEAIEREGRIAIVLAHEERPPSAWPSIHPLATLGKIEFVERMPDERYNLVLRGLVRVEVGKLDPHPLDPEDPARWFAAELVARGEAVPDLQDPRVADAKAALLMTARRYGERLLEGHYPAELLTEAAPYAAVVNQAATMLRSSLAEKQGLLTLDDVGERAERVERAMLEQLDAQGAVETFTAHRPRDVRLN